MSIYNPKKAVLFTIIIITVKYKTLCNSNASISFRYPNVTGFVVVEVFESISLTEMNIKWLTVMLFSRFRRGVLILFNAEKKTFAISC